MGKTFVYIVLLGILGFGVYYFLIRKNDSLYADKNANFTFVDTGSIGKIFLVENNGRSITVERNETNNWIVNKTFPAMPIQMINILTCLRLQSALAPVSDKEHDRVIKLLSGLGTKVEVYDRKGKKLRSFYVAGQGPNFHGSYMIIEHATQPYLVEIQGFEGYLTPRYSTDINEWRSRSVFSVTEENIQSVSLEYPTEPLYSFTMNNTGGLTVDLDPKIREQYTSLNEKRVHDYLGFFKNINAEGYLNGVTGMDSIIRNAQIRCRMSVTTKTKETTSLDIYWIDLNERARSLTDQTSTDPSNRPKDVERLYAVNHASHDTLLIQARTFDKLMRAGSEFYQQ